MALANLNILMPVTMESVVALAVGVSSRANDPGTSTGRPLMIILGNSWNRNLEALSQLDTCLNSHEHVPNIGLQSPLFYGA